MTLSRDTERLDRVGDNKILVDQMYNARGVLEQLHDCLGGNYFG